MNVSVMDNLNVSAISVGTKRSKRKIKKYYKFYSLWRMYRFLGALSSCLALIPATISYEHSYDPERKYDDCMIIQENTFAYRFPVLLFSFLAIGLELAYKHYLFRWEQYYPYTFEELPPTINYTYLELVSMVRSRKFKEYLMTKRTWLVVLINLIFPYPGISTKVVVPQYIEYQRYEICYFLEEFLYFIMFFRLFYLILAICAYSKYENNIARRIWNEHRVGVSASLSFRCYASINPVFILAFLLLIPGIIVFGIGIRLFERPLAKQDLSSIENSMWFVLVTMTTVGYGDRIVYTIFGRTIVCLAIIWGGISLSLTFVTIGSFLKLKPNEDHSYRAILAHRESGIVIFNSMQEKFMLDKDKIKGIDLAYYQFQKLMGLKFKTTSDQSLRFRTYEKMMKNLNNSLNTSDDILKKLRRLRASSRHRKDRSSFTSRSSFLGSRSNF